MSGLVIKLAPKERLLINSAVIENGDRRTRLAIVTPNARILRLKDAIHPQDATTPVKRACYFSQLLLSGDGDPDQIMDLLMAQLKGLSHAFRNFPGEKFVQSAMVSIEHGEIYSCLKSLRQLLPIEDGLLRST